MVLRVRQLVGIKATLYTTGHGGVKPPAPSTQGQSQLIELSLLAVSGC